MKIVAAVMLCLSYTNLLTYLENRLERSRKTLHSSKLEKVKIVIVETDQAHLQADSDARNG